MQVPKKKVKRRKWEVKSPNRSLNETVSLFHCHGITTAPSSRSFCVSGGQAVRSAVRHKEGKKEKLQISNHLSWKPAAQKS